MVELSELCATAKFLSENRTMRIILTIRIVIALAGIILSIFLVRIQRRRLIMHKNAQDLLLSHHILSIVHSASSLTINAFDLIRFAQYHSDPCDYLITTIFSVSLRSIFVVGLIGTVWALFTMALERIIATYYYQTYEKSGRRFWSFIFIPLQWILSALIVGGMIFNTDWKELKVQVSLASAKTSTLVSQMTKIMAAVELFTICLLLGLLHYNLKMKKRMRESPLTEKYQIDENIRSIRVMLPMAVTHFCCFMPMLVAFPIYYRIDANVDPRQYAIFLEAFGTTVLYSPLLLVVILWRYKVIEEGLRKSFDRGQPEEMSQLRGNRPACEHIRHFELLESMWNE